MNHNQKIPIIRLNNAPEEQTYWAVMAHERDNMDLPFIETEKSTWDYNDLDAAKRIAIELRTSSSDFRRNVKIVQKVIDDQFC